MGKKTTQQILIKVCCVVASICLWLYISNWENPIETYKVKNVTVELINVDALKNSKFAILPGQKFEVNLNIRGTASDIFRLKAEDFKVVADMSTYAVKKGDNRVPVQVTHAPNNINIINGDNMMVDVKLDVYEEKTVPIKVKLEGQPKNGLYASEATSTPTDAIISGPANYVDKVSYAEISQDVTSLIKDVELIIPLKAVDGDEKIISEVKVQPETAQIFIPIKTAKNVKVNVKTIGNLNNTLILKSMVPSQNNVDVSGSIEDLESVQSIDTEPIDLDKIDSTKTIDVKLKIPSKVRLVNSSDTVSVKVNVDKIIQKTIIKDVQFNNIGAGLTAQSDIKKITIVVSGSESIINALKDEDIACNVDLTGMGEGTQNAAVKISAAQNISIISVNPQNINVNIKKS